MARAFTVMGVVNVTPDSFSDGGRFLDEEAAVAHALTLAAQGAEILDIGGESTRPGAEPVGEEEERRRVVGVIERLAAADTGAELSIDTSKRGVAAAALDAGATWVNDVTALRSAPELAGLIADRGAMCCLMHMLGEPRTMQENPRYGDVVDEVRAFLEERLAFAVAEGVPEARIVLDPGIGFGKTVVHNLELIDRLGELREIGRPVVVGASRKRFIGAITGREVGDRLGGSIAAAVLALARGADVLRVHDVGATRDAVLVAEAILGRREWREPDSVAR